MTSPEVSIIITNYNYSKYLARCIRSCLSQQNVNCEVIVVDDCSTDNSLEVLEPFMEEIKVIRQLVKCVSQVFLIIVAIIKNF